MGIYGSGAVFGIRIYTFHDDMGDTLFEQKYDVTMSEDQLNTAYVFYNQIKNKDEIRVQYYTECSSTYSEGTYMMWCPMSLDLFVEKCGSGV
jgi:hypothetical protein